MKTFKSWRWSRLIDLSAFKRLLTHPQWIMPLILVLLFLWLMTDKTLGLPEAMEWLYWISCALLAVSIVQSICGADKYYEIKSGKKIIRKIYLYTPGHFSSKKFITMIICGKNYETFEKLLPHHYDFYEWKDFTSFLFEIDGNSYYCSPVSAVQPLGHSMGTIAFANQEQPNKMIVLDDHGTTTLEADAFFVNGAYIPPLASKQIYNEVTDEKLDKPQDYLIAKRGKKYTVYGLYYLDFPACRELKVPYIIFKEGDQEVILQWIDEYGYREIFRTRNSVKRAVSDVFVELSYQHGIGGTIRKFNEITQKLELLYKGYFHAIDFDSGAVIGDNGYEYIPEDNF